MEGVVAAVLRCAVTCATAATVTIGLCAATAASTSFRAVDVPCPSTAAICASGVRQAIRASTGRATTAASTT